MNRTSWKDTLELVGIAAIVASLIFVGFQLRLEQQTARAALGQSEISTRADLNLGVSEHAEIFDKANRGESLSGSELIVMKSITDARFRRALINSDSSRSIRGGDGSLSRHLFAIFLFENPGAHAIWERQRNDEFDMLQVLSPQSIWINEYANDVRDDISKLEQGISLERPD